MKYVRIGKTGLKVSKLCLGCMSYGKGQTHSDWTLDEEHSLPFFKRAFEHGINFFDTADAYSEGASEIVLGKAIREYSRREEVVIATKFFGTTGPGQNERGASRKHIMNAVDASLKRLGTDYIDLYQLHRWDYETPFEETAEALNDLVRAGKVLHLGASSMHTWQFAKALGIQERNGFTKFSSMQPQYNLVYREEEREMLPLCLDQGIGVIPWSPLARGFLAGNRNKEGSGNTARAKSDAFARHLYFREDDFEVQQRLSEIAAAKDLPPMKVALAWVASRAAVTSPIIGATKLEQLDQAVESLDVILSDEEVKKLEEPYKPHPVLGHN
ncbi:aldo/keto reductase [Pseudomonas sp. BN414]|uniref:aldo/keto reductase n=1 Tax=Pseudomonas sp. BN414 TaxID=2567888 RepID=UPI0024571F11|nr:aldo/keto reductase [Pseudomonas sp. BN414]MDH4565171.1 aldo/keto reductase [Pseudomonas sp. BN414]